MNDNLRYESDLKIKALYESNAHELRKPRELGVNWGSVLNGANLSSVWDVSPGWGFGSSGAAQK
jgi:hypothetical protein